MEELLWSKLVCMNDEGGMIMRVGGSRMALVECGMDVVMAFMMMSSSSIFITMHLLRIHV